MDRHVNVLYDSFVLSVKQFCRTGSSLYRLSLILFLPRSTTLKVFDGKTYGRVLKYINRTAVADLLSSVQSLLISDQ